MKVQEVAIDKLSFDPANARKHNPKNIEAIKGSLARFGQQKPIVVDQNMVVRAGNGTLEAAKLLGWDKIKVYKSDLNPADLMAFAVADNRTAELAEWDDEILKKTLAELDDLGFDVSEFGFDWEPEAEGTEGLTDPDEVPEVEENKFGVERGQIWLLGEHRLMCGDSTKESDLASLCGDVAVDQWITDPPYNVDYTGNKGMKIQNDSMGNQQFRQFLNDAFGCAAKHMKAGAVFYIWHADLEGLNFRVACFDVGLKVRQCLIWVKSSLVMGRQDYHCQHEPCLYGWKDGAGHLWASDRKQTTVLKFEKPRENDVHPTMKPVELIAYQIQNNTKGSDVVLDTFLGSGTTLIAAEKTGRKCYGMEIDPHYCSVIIERWQNFTGKEAKLGS